ncbi:MAG TPA: hypothetical protein VHH36_02690, partial [Candidatus Thermoplasmatota archaeon]|nr:hypothetical protein [Candidatus Thermoplasmatota archaeon]
LARAQPQAERASLPARLGLAAAMQAGIGSAAGVGLYGLWLHHPATILAVAPFALLARRHVRLLMAEQEAVEAARRAADLARELARTSDAESVAPRVLKACGDMFAAGRATLVLRQGDAEKERVWTVDFEGGPARTLPSIEAALTDGAGHPLGSIRLHPAARNRLPFGALDRQMLHVVAGEASVAMAGRRAA